jgi:putative ABC transport system permease protein
MDTLRQDIRYAILLLRRRPVFTAVAVLTLALGIGASTAIFSVVNGVLLHPLPYSEPDRLVRIYEKLDRAAMSSDRMEVAPANFLDWREQSAAFQEIAAYGADTEVLAAGEPEQASVAYVSTNLFSTLGVTPILGRTFTDEEDTPEHDNVAILSYGLWQSRYGADPNIVGQTITLDGDPFAVVGVMPAGFRFPKETDLWTPLALRPNQIVQREAHWLKVVARIRQTVTLDQARAEMGAIAQRLEQQYPATNQNWGVSIIPLLENEVGQVRPALLILFGAVMLLLLIACVNVANLLLARAATRQTEIAIRLAMGASRWRIIRQLLTESIILAVLGGAAGFLLVLWGMDSLLALAPENLPRIDEAQLDGRVLAFTILVSAIAGVIFGLVPALQTSKVDLNQSLKETGNRTGSGSRARALGVLVASEIALSLVILVGAGLLARSFLELWSVDPGIRPKQVLTMEISMPSTRYGGNNSREQRVNFYRQLIERVEAIPGVESAGAVDSLPLGGSGRVWRLRKEGHAPEGLAAGFQVVTTNYFRSMGINLKRGRPFTEADGESSPQVLIINETMARRFWPGEESLGRRVVVRNEEFAREVIGVVGDVRHFGLDRPAEPEMYVPYSQLAVGAIPLVVRASGDGGALAEAVKTQVRAVDADVAVAKVRTMTEVVSASLSRQRFAALLFSLFALVALVLAGVGIYGVMAYSISQRTREIGIRMALGAEPRDILRLVVGRGARLTLIGVVAGLAAAFALTRLMSGLLFGISATDPITFLTIALLLTAVALLASYIPARKAMRVEPTIALRYE